MNTQVTRPPTPIRTDESNSFAHHTMSERLPAIIDETLEHNPDYPPLVVDALRRLKEEIVTDQPLRSIAAPAPDWGSWEEQRLRHRGESWLHAEWFFAEHLFYRRFIEAVRWWETGRDPFAPIKEVERETTAYAELLKAAAEVCASAHAAGRDSGALEEALDTLLLLDLWGNRADLSHKGSVALGTRASADELIADDRPRIFERLQSSQTARAVHLVTDNAGSELAMDLLLADLLVSMQFEVVFHVKMHPTYVSDTTVPDVHSFLRWSEAKGARVAEAGRRLQGAFEAGMIRMVPDLFWNSGRFISELPPRLTEPMKEAALVLFKGDVNYRRLSKDTVWPPDTGFPEAVGRLPAPAAVLRTMKSDTLFGLPADTTAALDEQDPEWRSNGRRGLIQYFA